jgi:hypothetical protein
MHDMKIRVLHKVYKYLSNYTQHYDKTCKNKS